MIGELVKIPKNTISDSIFLQDKPTVDSIYTEPQNDQFVLWTDSLILPPCPIVGVDTITKYKVAFFLPFYLNINDTLGKYVDIVVRDEDGHEHIETVQRTGNVEDKIYPRSKLFINFYQGALLALKNLKDMGVSIDIHVFDTQNDSLHLSQILKASKFENFDLFIGPVFGDMLKIVGDYAWEHHINIVSPLSNDNEFIDHNPYAFQVIPPLEVQMQHASDYLNSIDTKNYIVIHDGKNLDQEYISQFKRQLFAQMNNENFDQIKYNEVLYYDARDSVLKEVFTKGMENIVIVPSSNQAFVTDILGKLNGYSYEYNIKIFGQPLWSRFENIELDNFHNTNTHIFSNSFIDYSQANVSSFVQSYRYHFKGEPNKYAFQGYDITKYFCLALNKYGRDFRKCIHMHDPELLQTSYRFVPFSDQGGYQNTSIFILEYSKSNRLNKVAQFP
jgi:ABC-type branched-subunit amino acid transport system substrate-binding protein